MLWGQSRCEVFVKIQQKKMEGGGADREGSGGGLGWWGFMVDVNAMLGEGGDVGYEGCEPRIEGIAQCTKKILYNIKKIKKVGVGGGGGVIFEPKTPSIYLKKKEQKKKNKNVTEPGFEPTTSGLENLLFYPLG